MTRATKIEKKLPRRAFLQRSAAALTGLGAAVYLPNLPRFHRAVRSQSVPSGGPHLRSGGSARKVICIGMDGMDPKLLERFIAEGSMPTFKQLMQNGSYSKLRTTMPPQTPVAWSSFISGTDPGGHGIFDFIHRDPKKFEPYLSTSRSFDAKRKITVGDYSIPIGAGHVELMRRGPVLWSVLEEHGIPATVFQIPSNFPVVDGTSKTISGVGTPDLRGAYGAATLFVEEAFPHAERLSSQVKRVTPIEHVFSCPISGPKNSFRTDRKTSTAVMKVYRDPERPNVKIELGDHELVLKEGEWSEWTPLTFELLGQFATISGMVRIFVKHVHPHLRIYVSPINVDPMSPALPISSPPDYSRELSQAVGRFYTQGFPADTKSLSESVLSDEDYFSQAKIVLDENFAALDYQLKNFDEGFFFFYFSNLDQNTHMFWRTMDPSHPLYDPQASPAIKGAVKYFYNRMDEALRMVVDKVDSSTTLIVLSDHGFVPFTREFNLSSWLVDQGYTAVNSRRTMQQMKFFEQVDWLDTSAYALGLNGLYLNIAGRDRHGSVARHEVAKLKHEIIEKLQQAVDPRTDQRAVSAAYDAEKIFSPNYLAVAPDILVGYAPGYRISDEAAFGQFPEEIFNERTDKWAADHCIYPDAVPGVLISNRSISAENPALWDLAPTILNEFGIEPPSSMTGKKIFAT